MEKIIEVKKLKKSYGQIKAVNNIDFYVEKGKLFAYLGTNGAGKSTTIDMISTLLKPDSGEVIIDGYLLGRDNDQIRRKIGVVFQDNVLDKILTVEENLKIRAGFYDLKGKERKEAIKQAVLATNLTECLKQPYGKLSGGQRRRADIARALLNAPEVLFLDEPTTGLDPQSRKMVWDMILKLKNEKGMTVFLTTHYMEEAAAADYIIIMDHGSIAAKGAPNELREKFTDDALKIKPVIGKERNIYQFLQNKAILYKVQQEIIEIQLKDTKHAIEILNDIKNDLESFETIHGTLEEVFLRIADQGINQRAVSDEKGDK